MRRCFTLLSVVIVLAVAELVVNRLCANLLPSRSTLGYATQLVGTYLGHATVLLSATVGLWSCFALMTRSLLRSLPPLAIALYVVGLVLAHNAVVARDSAYLAGGLSLLHIMYQHQLWLTAVPVRFRCGLALLGAPHFAFALSQLAELAHSASFARLAVWLGEQLELLAICVGSALSWLLPPRPRAAALLQPLSLSLALLVTGGAAIWLQTAYPSASQSAYAALGFSPPGPPLYSLAYLVAFFLYVLTVTSSAVGPDPREGLAGGLLLVGIAGIALTAPLHQLLSALGFALLLRVARQSPASPGG